MLDQLTVIYKKIPAKWLRTGLGAIALLIVSAVSYNSWKNYKNSHVYIFPKKGTVIESVYGMGIVVSANSFNLKVGVSEKISRLYVREGDYVKNGQELVKLEGLPVFRSSIGGTVTKIFYSQGETVFPGSAVLTVMDIHDRYITVTLEQEGALRVKKGQKARFSFESIRDKRFGGVVEALYPGMGQFIARIKTDDLPDEILPGMTADVAIDIGKKEDVILIPFAAIQSGRVNLRRNGKRMKNPVTIGNVDGQWAELVSGDIKMSDEILVLKTNMPEKTSPETGGN